MLALRQRAQRIDLGTGEIDVARPTRRSMQGGNGTFRTGLAFAFVDLEEWCRHDQCLRTALLRQSNDLGIHDPLGGLQRPRLAEEPPDLAVLPGELLLRPGEVGDVAEAITRAAAARISIGGRNSALAGALSRERSCTGQLLRWASVMAKSPSITTAADRTARVSA